MTARGVGIIGFGGVAQIVASRLAQVSENRLAVSGILVRPLSAPIERYLQPVSLHVTSIKELLATKPAIIAECAGHDAVRAYGPDILRRGCDLVVISTGALADPEIEAALARGGAEGGGRLHYCAGAVGAIDALAAARLSGLLSVCYRSRKPPAAWLGTPAEKEFDLQGIVQPVTFFRGNARDAARLYPKNANVAATIALAGLGFDLTKVELIADPQASQNSHEIDAESRAGSLHVSLIGYPLPENPKTSALTAFSILRTLSNLVLPAVV